MTAPAVSAVIATHNRPELLRKALAGVAAQRFDGVIETVVVFDRSEPDESLRVDHGDRPVRITTNARTPGLPGARNTGADLAAAPVLAFCDDDDEWLPDKTAKQLALLDQRPDVDVVVAGTVVEYGDRRVERVPPAEIRFDDLLRSRVVGAHPSNTVVRREAFFDRIGPVDEAIPGGYAEDYDLLLRAARLAPILAVPEPLVLIRWGGSYFSDRWDTIDRALAYLIEKLPELADEPRGRARLLGQRAFASAAAGRRSDALRLTRQTVEADWREPRAYLALLAAAGVPAERVLHTLHRFGRGV